MESQFVSKERLAQNPEIFIPENCATLPSWNAHSDKGGVEKRVLFYLASMSEASYRELKEA